MNIPVILPDGSRFRGPLMNLRSFPRCRKSAFEVLEDRRLLAVVIDYGSDWRYLDNGSNQGTNWKNEGFNDSSWQVGAAELGYGEGDEATTISYGGNASNKFRTTYFRHSFCLASVTGITGLNLGLEYDDGAVVHINGDEVFRTSNMGSPGSYVSYSTLASSTVSDAVPENFQISASDLKSGDNVVAVEVHQATVDSSDLSFDLSLSTIGGSGSSCAGAGAPSAVDDSYEITEGSKLVTIPSDEAPLVDFNEYWFYDDSGADLGTAWTEVDYAANLWFEGLGELGYGDGNEWTLVGCGPSAPNCNSQNHATTYFRKSVYLDPTINPADITSLALELLRDDGAAVYLNGVELYRTSNLPADAAYDTYATSAAPGDGRPPIEVTVDLAQAGATLYGANDTDPENVFAVEVHNRSRSDNDLSFDMRVTRGIRGVTENDSDPDDDEMTVSLVRDVAGGTLNLNSDGSFTYQPFSDFSGVDNFEYQVEDSTGLKSTAFVTLNVTNTQDEPIANNDRYVVDNTAILAATATKYRNLTSSQKTVLVPLGATWRYQDNGSNQGSAWKSATFNPDTPPVGSAWRTGNGEFGYGESGQSTTLRYGPNDNNSQNDANNKHLTYYFRHVFSTPAGMIPSQVDKLILSLTRDDGAAVYLNGSEVLRSNIKPGVGYDAHALVDPNDGNRPEEVSINKGLLKLPGFGDNVIAVEIHQSSPKDSDLSFDLELLVPNGAGGVSVLANDVEPDNENLTVTLVEGPTHATSFNLNSSGKFIYNPIDSYNGEDQFTYMINDGHGGTATATVTISVEGCGLIGDFNASCEVDLTDVDLLVSQLGNPVPPADNRYDLVDNNLVDIMDLDYLIEAVLHTKRGDTDLDCDVDTADLTRSLMNFTSVGGTGKTFGDGDTDGDGDIDTGDLTTSLINFTSVGTGCPASLQANGLGQASAVILEQGNSSASEAMSVVDALPAELAVASGDNETNPCSSVARDHFFAVLGDRTYSSGGVVKKAESFADVLHSDD